MWHQLITMREYVCISYREISLVVNHFLDILAHEPLRLLNNILCFRYFVAFLSGHPGLREPVDDLTDCFFAMIEGCEAFDVAEWAVVGIEVSLWVNLFGNFLKQHVRTRTFVLAVREQRIRDQILVDCRVPHTVNGVGHVPQVGVGRRLSQVLCNSLCFLTKLYIHNKHLIFSD